MSLSDNVQFSMAEKAWKPTAKMSTRSSGAEEDEDDDPEQVKTQVLFNRLHSIVNKLTRQTFQELMKQVMDLTIDTEERLKGTVELIFEKAISEPNSSVVYAYMCRCLMGLKVPTSDKPGVFVNFRKLLLNRCQKEFEKDQDDDEIFEKKQKGIEAAKEGEERERLRVELQESRDQARRRSLGNIKFICELFKLKMVTEAIMHDCVVKLLKNHDEESLECLCMLLSTIGKDLDFEKAKPRMDQYFNQMDQIIKEKKTSSRISLMLQDVLDLRKSNWLQDEGWNTVPISRNRPIDTTRLSKITKPGSLDFNNQLLAPGGKGRWGSWGKGSSGETGAKPTSGEPDSGRPATSTLDRFSALQQSGSLVSSSDSDRRTPQRRYSRFQPGSLDFNNQLLAPGGKGRWGSWGKGSSGETGAKPTSGEPDSGRPATSTLDRFSALQQSGSLVSSSDSDRRTPQRRYSRFQPPGPHRSQHGQRKEPWKSISLEQSKTQELFRRLRSILNKLTPQKFQQLMKQVMDMTIDTEERLKGAIDLIFEKAIFEPKFSVAYANMCRCLMGLKVPTSDKPEVTVNFRKLLLNRCQKEFEKDQDDDEIIEKKQKEIEAAKEGEERERLRVELQESRDQAHRRSLGNIKFMGELFKLKMLTEVIMHDCVVKLLKNHDEESLECVCMLLSTIGKDLDFEKAKPRMDQYFNNMDKIIKEKKISSKIRFKLQDILDLRKNNWVPHREDQGPKTIEQIHKEAECAQVAEDEDANKFVTEQKVEFTTGEETESKEVDEKKVLTGEEISKQLDRLIQDKANNERIRDWAEANLDEQQTASNQFVRALMTSLCQSAIICDNPYRVDARQIGQRARLLHIYLSDEQKELQALYALQALIVHMEQPANLLRMFFDVLYDEDVIKEEAFHEWEASRDPAEQKGKGVAKRSVTAFFTWLREAEEDEESD